MYPGTRRAPTPGPLRPLATAGGAGEGVPLDAPRPAGTGASGREVTAQTLGRSTAAPSAGASGAATGAGASTLGGRSASTSQLLEVQNQQQALLKAMSREDALALAESQAKLTAGRAAAPAAPSVVRSALTGHYAALEDARQRERAKQLAVPLHLRTGTNPIDMGCPIQYTTQTVRALSLPVKMAVDPKWSTELKRTNDKVGLRIEYERRLSATVPGSISPELPFMYPKRHLSNPPTPFFVAGGK